jgi:Zn-dependent peptidase ImmA (M78 family)
MTSKALPKKIDLCYYLIHVKYVTTGRLKDITDWEEGDDAVEGAWMFDDDTIYVDRSLSKARKRYTISHELIHAAADIRDALAREGKDYPK